MKYPVVIKQSPFVLIARIARMEIVLSAFIFLVSFLTNYEDLYQGSFISSFVRYDIFLALAASLIQLIITFVIFVRWHNEEFRIRELEILHRRGFFFNREDTYLFKDISNVEQKRSALEFIFNYGTIVISTSDGRKPFRMQSIENTEVYTKIIKDAWAFVNKKNGKLEERVSVLDLILEGEGKKLELKQTLRWDLKQKIANKNLEKSVAKTIAAFLNGEGGRLLIGVTDNGKIYGIEEDINTLIRKDRDGFENHFNQIIRSMIGAEFRQYIDVSFEQIDGKTLCLVEVEPSPKPVYLRANGDEEFFIRTGNSTSPLKVSEVSSYIDSHWSK